ncbi:MAG: hypothetical protein WC520_02490 [Candidatus Paceibacterota bacterium]
MNKIVKIIIGLIVILAIIGVIYFVFQKREEGKMGYVQFEDFVKQESNGEIYFENKEAGLRFKVPQGWNYRPSQLASVSLATQDFKPFRDNSSAASIPQVGCWIGVNLKREKENSPYDLQYTVLKRMISDGEYLNMSNKDGNIYEVIDFNNYRAIKETMAINDLENPGNYIFVKIPIKNIIYSFEADLFGRDKEKCLQSFNDFLTTVSIEK